MAQSKKAVTKKIDEDDDSGSESVEEETTPITKKTTKALKDDDSDNDEEEQEDENGHASDSEEEEEESNGKMKKGKVLSDDDDEEDNGEEEEEGDEESSEKIKKNNHQRKTLNDNDDSDDDSDENGASSTNSRLLPFNSNKPIKYTSHEYTSDMENETTPPGGYAWPQIKSTTTLKSLNLEGSNKELWLIEYPKDYPIQQLNRLTCSVDVTENSKNEYSGHRIQLSKGFQLRQIPQKNVQQFLPVIRSKEDSIHSYHPRPVKRAFRIQKCIDVPSVDIKAILKQQKEQLTKVVEKRKTLTDTVCTHKYLPIGPYDPNETDIVLPPVISKAPLYEKAASTEEPEKQKKKKKSSDDKKKKSKKDVKSSKKRKHADDDKKSSKKSKKSSKK